MCKLVKLVLINYCPYRCRSMSVGVGRTYKLSVFLFVCLFVRSITQKRTIPKCSNFV